MNQLNNTLKKLVEIPSVTRSTHEKEIVDYTYNLLKEIKVSPLNELGVDIFIDRVDKIDKNGVYHGGVICNIKVSNQLETVGLLGHLDVVPVVDKNWNTDPFKLVEEEDRFLGRGTCDMKAGLAIMIEVLRKSLKQQPNKNISLLFTSGEECGIPNGLSEIIKSDKLGGLDFVIALEPTGGKINTGVFGYLDGEFHFKGRSCHSSNPHLGENAIHKMYPLLELLSNPEDIIGEVSYYGEKLREALSATNVSGGIACNVVPDSASLAINYRYSPEKSGKEVEQRFIDIQKQMNAEGFTILEHNPSSEIVLINNPLLLEFINKTRNNISSSLNVVSFWSDISQTSQAGIPSINFGPGSIEQAHTDNEFLMKDSFKTTWDKFKNYLFD